MSKCKSCNQELDFPKAVIKQLTTCPFCNAPFRMSDFIEPEILGKPVTAKSVLKTLVKDYGMEIFSKENEHRFRKELMRFPETLKKERDALQLLLIKDILLEKQVLQAVANQFSSKMAKKSQFLNNVGNQAFKTWVSNPGGKPVVRKFVLHGVETEFQTVYSQAINQPIDNIVMFVSINKTFQL